MTRAGDQQSRLKAAESLVAVVRDVSARAESGQGSPVPPWQQASSSAPALGAGSLAAAVATFSGALQRGSGRTGAGAGYPLGVVPVQCRRPGRMARYWVRSAAQRCARALTLRTGHCFPHPHASRAPPSLSCSARPRHCTAALARCTSLRAGGDGTCRGTLRSSPRLLRRRFAPPTLSTSLARSRRGAFFDYRASPSSRAHIPL